MATSIIISPHLDVPVQPQNSPQASANDNCQPGKFSETLKKAEQSEQKVETKPTETKEPEVQEEKTVDTTEQTATKILDQQTVNIDVQLTPETQTLLVATILAQPPQFIAKTDLGDSALTNLSQSNSQTTTIVSIDAQKQNVQTSLAVVAELIKSVDVPQQNTETPLIASQTDSKVAAQQSVVKAPNRTVVQTASPNIQIANQTEVPEKAHQDVQTAVKTVQTQPETGTISTKIQIKTTAVSSETVQSQNIGNSPVPEVNLADQPKQEGNLSDHKKNTAAKDETKSVNKESINTIDSLLSLTELGANATRARQSIGVSIDSTVVSEEINTSKEVETLVKVSTANIQPENPTVVSTDILTEKTLKFTPTEKTEKALTSQSAEIPKKIIDQVVREISLTKSPERSDLVVKLTPPSLGTLRLHVTQDASGITTQIVASSQQVKNLLNQHMPTLITAMNDAGIKMDSLTITTDNKFESGTFAESKGFNQTHGQSSGSRQQSKSYQQYTGGAPVLTASGLVRTHESAAFTWYA